MPLGGLDLSRPNRLSVCWGSPPSWSEATIAQRHTYLPDLALERGGISLPIKLGAADPAGSRGTADLGRLSAEQYDDRWTWYVNCGNVGDDVLRASLAQLVTGHSSTSYRF